MTAPRVHWIVGKRRLVRKSPIEGVLLAERKAEQVRIEKERQRKKKRPRR
jgi:hypothetical protein